MAFRNALLVFYADRTWDYRDFTQVKELEPNKLVVSMVIFHQRAGAGILIDTLARHDVYAIRGVPNSLQPDAGGMTVHTIDFEPGPADARRFFYPLGAPTEVNIELPDPPEVAAGGMEVVFYSRDFNAVFSVKAEFAVLAGAAALVVNDFTRAQPQPEPPLRGTY